MNELDELRAKTFTPEKMTELDWFIWNNRNLRGEQAYAELTALRARVEAAERERDAMRDALEEISSGRFGKSIAVKNIARAALAKGTK